MPTTPSGSTFGTHAPYSSSSYNEFMGAPIVGRLPDLPDINAWLEAVRGIFGYETIPGLPGAVGPSVGGRGVFDTPVPSVPVLRDPAVPEWEPSTSDEEPEFSGIYGPGQEPTDWDAVYREYEILNPPTEEPVAHDWGHLIRQGIETYTGIGAPPVYDPVASLGTGLPAPTGGGGVVIPPGGGGQLCPPSGSCGGPRYLTYDCKTGQMSVRRRRRRRRLLTDGDKQDLGTIVAMFGKGAAAQIALAAAVKR